MSTLLEPFLPCSPKRWVRQELRLRLKPLLEQYLRNADEECLQALQNGMIKLISDYTSLPQGSLAVTCTLYGIPNCDKMRKARNLLLQHEIPYLEVNWKKQAPTPACLEQIYSAVQLKMINTRGTTARRLSLDFSGLRIEELKQVIIDNPSLLIRPLVVMDETILAGLDSLQAFLEKK